MICGTLRRSLRIPGRSDSSGGITHRHVRRGQVGANLQDLGTDTMVCCSGPDREAGTHCLGKIITQDILRP